MASWLGHWVKRRVLLPVMAMLRMGCTPERLAWSLAVGVVVGINPLLGSTTLVALGAAAVFRLNVVASQLGNHGMYPAELALFPVFVKLGSLLFGTPRLALGREQLWQEVKLHPWATTRALWTWEWHALVVWACVAAVLLPALGFGLEPVLRRLAKRPVVG